MIVIPWLMAVFGVVFALIVTAPVWLFLGAIFYAIVK